MQIEFTLTFDDYREANDAILRSRKNRWLSRFGLLAVFLFVAALLAVFVVVTIANRATGQSMLPELKQKWVWLVLAAYLTFVALTAHGRALRRGWRGQPSLQLRRRVEIGENALVVDDSQTRVEHKWNAFVRYIEAPNLFVLMPSDVTLVIIPKRSLTEPGAVDGFRRLLDERVARPSVPGFPVTTVQAKRS